MKKIGVMKNGVFYFTEGLKEYTAEVSPATLNKNFEDIISTEGKEIEGNSFVRNSSPPD